MSETLHSVCALDCPDACSLLIDVDGAGRGSKLRGNPAHPVTRGFLCGKVARYLEREYSPDRLLYPLRRTGAKGALHGEARFARISWDEALREIAEKLRAVSAEFGPEAILPYSYAGTMGVLNNAGMDRRFFHRLGASRLDRTICSAAGGAGLMDALGVKYGTDTEDFRHAKLIVSWGGNILGTNVHLWPFIVEARRNGAKFYTIDPRENRAARTADRHFAIHPGSDTALALAMMHVIVAESLHDADYVARFTSGFEDLRAKVRDWTPERAASLTGIDAAAIADLARDYATTRPAVIRVNYGVQRSERGSMAVRAISLLPALVGAWRHVGGGVQLSTSGAFQLNRAALERADLQLSSPLGRESRIVNMVELGHALTGLDSPPVKAMVVYNSNPAAVAPDQNVVRRGLRREDLFTVVLDQFLTDTARFADIVLPVTTFLEHTDLYGAYGHYHLQLARPALAAPGETLPNTEIFRRLAARMGFTEPCFTDSDDDMIRTLLDTDHPFLKGIAFERLEREHSVRLNIGEHFLPFARGGFGTPSGRCEFRAATLDYTPPLESRRGDPALAARFPLELISPKNDDSMNSTFGYRSDVDGQTSTVLMHPEDAAPRRISTGDAVRIFNGRGECLLEARVAPGVAKGVAVARSVRWPSLAPGGNSVNMLTSQRLTDQAGGAVFYSCLVQVEKVGD